MTLVIPEVAEILKEKYLDGEAVIRGYQSFSITKDNIVATDNDTHDWASTNHKIGLVEQTINELKPKSFMDFGSNLGVLVFKAAQMGVDSIGIDYLEDYISCCNRIKDHLRLDNTVFIHDTFEVFDNYDYQVDVLSIFNVHHHLWGRTEQPQTLQEINDTLMAHCQHMLVEFPNENDRKALKHMRQHPGKGVYSEKEFLKTVKQYNVKELERSAPNRPIYLISK